MYVDFFSEGMMHVFRVLEQLEGMQKNYLPIKDLGFFKMWLGSRARVYEKMFSEGMMHVFRVLEQFGVCTRIFLAKV